jgi:hypothetical protein
MTSLSLEHLTATSVVLKTDRLQASGTLCRHEAILAFSERRPITQPPDCPGRFTVVALVGARYSTAAP